MQYFFSSLAIYRDRGKKVEIIILGDIYGVPGGCRWRPCEFKNLKVWTKSFRLMFLGALYDKSSLLWLPVKSSDFE